MTQHTRWSPKKKEGQKKDKKARLGGWCTPQETPRTSRRITSQIAPLLRDYSESPRFDSLRLACVLCVVEGFAFASAESGLRADVPGLRQQWCVCFCCGRAGLVRVRLRAAAPTRKECVGGVDAHSAADDVSHCFFLVFFFFCLCALPSSNQGVLCRVGVCCV